MSAELQMSSAANDSVAFPYRAISRSAIVSVGLLLLALPGLLATFMPLLALALVGALTALVALRTIRRYPAEYSGRALAVFGLAANLMLIFGGIALHTYIYLTEVPEGYTRVQFYDLQQPDNAPDRPTEKAIEIHNQDIFLKGYIHPASGSGLLKHFILVPDLGTCCFGGQPDSSDMIEVTLGGGQTTKAGLIQKKLAGKFIVTPAPQKVTDFDNTVYYRLRADQVR